MPSVAEPLLLMVGTLKLALVKRK